MAVEMPGSVDICSLNLQFGALQFGSEPVLPEYDTSPHPAAATVPSSNQVQNSLYSSPSRWGTSMRRHVGVRVGGGGGGGSVYACECVKCCIGTLHVRERDC